MQLTAFDCIAKKMIKRTFCLDCRSCLIYNTENQSASECFEYFSTSSRGALMQPATDLMHYVSKSFAMLDLCEYIIHPSNLHERVAAENVIKFNDLPQPFLCDIHLKNIINRTICNVFFNLFLLANSRLGVATADICIFMTWHLFYGRMPFLPPTHSSEAKLGHLYST